MVVRFLCMAAVLSIPSFALAKDFGVRGETFEIVEPHLFEYFQSKLKTLQDSGEIDKINQAMVDKTKERIFQPPPVTFLTKAVKEAHFYWDPTVTAPQDYLGPDGEVVVKKGRTENPFDYVSLRQPMVFIDGSDVLQVEYALDIYNSNKNGAKIILTDGRPFDVMREHKVRVFFDQRAILSQKLGLSKVPSLVTQEGRMLRIDEVVVK